MSGVRRRTWPRRGFGFAQGAGCRLNGRYPPDNVRFGGKTCPRVGTLSDLGPFVIRVELLAPPLGLATLERTLGLRDVVGELALLRAQLLLELGHGLLARL